MAFLCNAFNDPSNPWYYVIGVVFLLVVFGALAAYIILTGKKSKNKEETSTDGEPKTENDTAPTNDDQQPATVSTEQSNQDNQ